MTKNSTKVKYVRKRISKKYTKGQAAFLLLLAVVITGAIVLVGGILPKNANHSFSDQSAGSPNPHLSNQTDKSLQLKTFGFINPTSSCSQTAAVDFLVDRSGSMDFMNQVSHKSKLQNLQDALNLFINNFPSSGVTGLQSFSGETNGSVATNDVPINLFSTNKAQFQIAVAALQAGGSTHTKEAFSFVAPLIISAQAKYPKQKFALVFISDGIPETGLNNALKSNNQAICPVANSDPLCEQSPQQGAGCRCFDSSQDPTSVANTLKQQGIRIFTIGYVADEDAKFQPALTKLMTDVASPGDFYQAPADDKISAIVAQISNKLCP